MPVQVFEDQWAEHTKLLNAILDILRKGDPLFRQGADMTVKECGCVTESIEVAEYDLPVPEIFTEVNCFEHGVQMQLRQQAQDIAFLKQQIDKCLFPKRRWWQR